LTSCVMFRPGFQRTDLLIEMLARIEVARDRILRAPIVPRWEAELRREALVRSAHHSTSIEGNPLSLEEVTDLLAGRDVLAHSRDKQEVLNYAEILRYIDRHFSGQERPITEQTILHLHALVMKDVLPPTEAGQYRQVPVIVGVPATGEVVHRPPDWEEVPQLVGDLVTWLNSPDAVTLMSVLEAGVAHYELVRIHPFTDGNGRTARALATLVLARRNFDTKRFFALDEYYNQDRASYYEALRSVDPSTRDLTEWLEYFVQGIAVEMVRVEQRVEELSQLHRVEARATEAAQVSLNPRQVKLLDHLRRSGGGISNREYQELFLVSKRTASNDLSELKTHGLLVVEGAGRGTRYRLAAPDV
jgi:Fic family protein